jgi:hypothetical protein
VNHSRTAYNIALGDWFNRPEILEIDLGGWVNGDGGESLPSRGAWIETAMGLSFGLSWPGSSPTGVGMNRFRRSRRVGGDVRVGRRLPCGAIYNASVG